MNTSLLSIINRIVAEQGEGILADPQRLKGFFKQYAHNEPKDQCLAFGRCIEQGYYQEFKKTKSAAERQKLKPWFVQNMQGRTELNSTLCNDALDLLEAVMFGVPAPAPILAPQPQPAPAAPPPVQPASAASPPAQYTPPPQPVSYQPAAPQPQAGSPVQVNVQVNQPNQPQTPQPKGRHGFTSFCLYIGLIGSIIGALACFASGDYLVELIAESTGMLIPPGVFTLFGLVYGGYALGYLLLLNWKKIGFWILVAANGFFAYLNLDANAGITVAAITFIIPTLLLFWVLKFRNFLGKSTWDQLV